MAKKANGKNGKISKSFMTIGPTLHYSHKNVQRCWILAVVVYVLTCLLWSKIVTGSVGIYNLRNLAQGQFWQLSQAAVGGLSMFEYPWQIVVLGLLMGMLTIIPVLISQLMSFRYSIVFIVAAFFLANLPGFAICVLVSCLAVACRPLRFRSRFVAIALCTAPLLLYWGLFGGAAALEPVKWGFSFVPWICAWIWGLAMAGVVLGIGHFTRYKPGLVWAVGTVALLAGYGLFETKVGFKELDYQLYVANNNPEEVNAFHEHSITHLIDHTIQNERTREYLAEFFYPTELIPLRAEVKRKVQVELSRGRWPSWFIVPKKLEFEEKRKELLERYNLFINRRSNSDRMPIALYYKALLSEYSPDIRLVGQREVLHFYSDYPFERSRGIWYRLYRDFGESAESLEARWRIAMWWSGQRRFKLADELLREAERMLGDKLEQMRNAESSDDSLFSAFEAPGSTAMTVVKLEELQRRLYELRSLIGSENQTESADSRRRLAEFVMLNPHSMDYQWQLEKLLEEIDADDPLRDNILLSKIKLIADNQLRLKRLRELHERYKKRDAGMRALFEIGLLNRKLWSREDESNQQKQKEYLTQAREAFGSFVNLYPQSIFSEQAQKNLKNLPTAK